jgi:hypothetical protein
MAADKTGAAEDQMLRRCGHDGAGIGRLNGMGPGWAPPGWAPPGWAPPG